MTDRRDHRERPRTETRIEAFDQMNDCSHIAAVETGRYAGSRPGATQGGARQRKVERAMGIEPTEKALPELEDKRFRANADAKCDWRVNFRGMWGNVGIREPTAVISIVLGRIAGQLRHTAKRSYVVISAGNRT